MFSPFLPFLLKDYIILFYNCLHAALDTPKQFLESICAFSMLPSCIKNPLPAELHFFCIGVHFLLQ